MTESWFGFPDRPSRFLRGRLLRYLLTSILVEHGGELTVAQLVARARAAGVVFVGRPSKVVSDALRWEVRWGRVERVRRGVYVPGQAPRSTRSRIRCRVRMLRTCLAQLPPDPAPDPDRSRIEPGTTVVLRL